MGEIDITMSVILENASAEFTRLSEGLMEKYGISVDMAAVAMEKALSVLKNREIALYASALLEAGRKNENAGEGE